MAAHIRRPNLLDKDKREKISCPAINTYRTNCDDNSDYNDARIKTRGESFSTRNQETIKYQLGLTIEPIFQKQTNFGMTEITLSAQQRLQLMNLLPQESGSLRESIQVKRLRDRINFSDEEQEAIDLDPQTGSFDPNAFQELDDKEMKFGERECDVIAGSFVRKEDEGEVPTNDAFVELALKLEDEIEEFRKDLD